MADTRPGAGWLESLPDAAILIDDAGRVTAGNALARPYLLGPAAPTGRALADILRPASLAARLRGTPPFGLDDAGLRACGRGRTPLLLRIRPCAEGDARWLITVVARPPGSPFGAGDPQSALRDTTLRYLAHDMRAPQASILALLDMLDSRAGPGELGDLAAWRDRIAAHARRTLALADDFIRLARAPCNAGAAAHLARADLGPLLLDAVDDCWPLAHARDIRLHTEVPRRPAVARVDRALCTRAIANLVDNAIKFSPPGAEVDCTLSADREGWCVRVRDHGPGIAAYDRARLFTPASRGHRRAPTLPVAASLVPGAGLGLAFVNAAVTMLGGHVGVDSAPGQGSEFRIHIPFAGAARPDA